MTSFFGLLLIMTSLPAGAGFFNSNLRDYQRAVDIQETDPTLSCKLLQKLSKETSFVLQDLAFLRQGLICEKPYEEAPFLIEEKPWLKKLDVERRIRLADLKEDWPTWVSLQIQKAESQKSQEMALQILKSAQARLEKQSLSPEIKTNLGDSITKSREKVAPRLIQKPRPEQALAVAQDLMKVRDFSEAQRWARVVMKRKESTLDELLLARKIRRSAEKLRQKPEAFLRFLKEDVRWAEKNLSPAVAYDLNVQLSRSLWTEGRTSEAQKILRGLRKKNLNPQQATEVSFVLGKIFEEKKEWTKALHEYSQASLSDFKTPNEKRVQFAKFWCHWKMGKNEEAISALEPLTNLGLQDSGEVSRGLYWKARALARLNQTEEQSKVLRQLRVQDPLGFYGVLTYAELKDALPLMRSAPLPSRFQKSDLFSADYFQALFDSNEREILKEAAQVTLSKLKGGESVEVTLPVFLAAARANLYLPLFSQIIQMEPETRRQILERDPELLFPLEFQNQIQKSAQDTGVPAELIFSIIRQESAFDPRARSFADAFGLMQILPSVSKTYFAKLKIPVRSDEDLYLPEVNIPYGTILLRDLLQKYEGRIFLAAASYNANEQALRRWVQNRWTGDTVEFIEEIPYEETRTYVKLILRNFIFYSRLLATDTKKPLLFPTEILSAGSFDRFQDKKKKRP